MVKDIAEMEKDEILNYIIELAERTKTENSIWAGAHTAEGIDTTLDSLEETVEYFVRNAFAGAYGYNTSAEDEDEE
jgi:hypothetical protein